MGIHESRHEGNCTEWVTNKTVRRTATLVIALSLISGCSDSSEPGLSEDAPSTRSTQNEDTPSIDNSPRDPILDNMCFENGIALEDFATRFDELMCEGYFEDLASNAAATESTDTTGITYESILDKPGALDFESVTEQLLQERAAENDELALSVLENLESDTPLLDQIVKEAFERQGGGQDASAEGVSPTVFPDWVQALLNNDPRIIENDPEYGRDLVEYLNTPADYLTQPEVVTVPPVTENAVPVNTIDYSSDLDGDSYHNLVDIDIDGDGIENPLDIDMDGDGIENHVDPEPWGPMKDTPYWQNSGRHSDNDWIPDSIDSAPDAAGLTVGSSGYISIFTDYDFWGTGDFVLKHKTFEQVYKEALQNHNNRIMTEFAIDDLNRSLDRPSVTSILFGFSTDSDRDGVLDAFDKLPGDDYADFNNNGVPDGRDFDY